VRDIVSLDSNKIIYPRGIVSKLKESEHDSPPVKRIEVFASDEKDTYGILRTLFVAYSSEKRLLDIAHFSNGVIHVRSMNKAGSATQDSCRQICEDKLLLKRLEEEVQEYSRDLQGLPFKRVRAPDLLVTPRWRERMNLELGARLIVSNPIESYEVPPPNL